MFEALTLQYNFVLVLAKTATVFSSQDGQKERVDFKFSYKYLYHCIGDEGFGGEYCGDVLWVPSHISDWHVRVSTM